MNIRILKESDTHLYQEVRLNALKINPEAFGSTHEKEVEFSLETVKERITPTRDKYILGAFDDRKSLVGIVAFIRENNLKTRHKGNVFGMYIAPGNRGHGLGKSLMKDLISRAKNCDGLEQINLTVVSENDFAKKLYKSLGFVVYGTERNALKYNGHYFDEDLLVLTI
ncbi:GNAT family N-acetyltransferase [Peribacillus muralis]|uniref:GNAT family N-acetyltransferase n=1 Tax=Peribacillus muralis TaxID=264697 RepID=UPI001F4E5467|nr:GNAT family N-acetyltransferase [Peribacillus muralis]MCK1992320.1 GNAT family N-acetyltransferase [Peribacillus muralis]MCK2012876.1 GNAT family N-acetyltransferase [Peribacillus muralis]